MAEARALFNRHIAEFEKQPNFLDRHKAIIYAACIIAEAIRNEMDMPDFRIIEPEKEPKKA